jgi:hypothetical protein
MVLSDIGALIVFGSIFLIAFIWYALACFTEDLLNKKVDSYEFGTEHEGLICILTLVICVVAWFTFASNFFRVKQFVSVKDYEYNIYAIEDNKSIHGNRYYIETDKTYDYLADYKDGQKQYSVDKDNAYIIENKTSTPHIEVYKNKPIKETKYTKLMFQTKTTEYKIVVPEKTLTNNFNIDLK